MGLESLFQRIDRLAGGRQSTVTIADHHLEHPRTKRAFNWVFWLLVFELLLGLGAVVFAIVIALGLAGAGWLAANGMARLRTADRFVTVKGSAEKIVNADLVVWPLACPNGKTRDAPASAARESNFRRVVTRSGGTDMESFCPKVIARRPGQRKRPCRAVPAWPWPPA